MAPLRRWVPGPARPAALAALPPAPAAAAPAVLKMELVQPQDLSFCAEFAVHGGVAVSEQGFEGEADLIRMKQAGLLELQRDPARRFAIIRVSLSAAARGLLAGRRPPAGPTRPGGAHPDAAEPAQDSPAATDKVRDQGLRRNGFEVARGLACAALKAELAAWRRDIGEQQGGAQGLEARLLNRIARIEAPFKA